MKKIYVFMILQAVILTVFAQENTLAIHRPEPLNSKDKKEYQGYTIRLIPAMPGSIGSYGFDIVADKKPVVHQLQNPLPFSPKGIQRKSDAYQIAEWMIREYKISGYWQNIIPLHTAQELKIETHY